MFSSPTNPRTRAERPALSTRRARAILWASIVTVGALGVVGLAVTPPSASVDGPGVAHAAEPSTSTAEPVAAEGPDITTAPCEWFADGRTIPAYTELEECVTADGARVAVATVPYSAEWAAAEAAATGLPRCQHDDWTDGPTCVGVGFVAVGDPRLQAYVLTADGHAYYPDAA